MCIMKYLLFFQDGLARKFPLDAPKSTIGRGDENDLIIDDDFLSRRHVIVSVRGGAIHVKDSDSSNGIYVQGERVAETTLEVGESFSAGRVEFFVRQGNLDEFKTAPELNPVFAGIRKDHEKRIQTGKTKTEGDIFTQILKTVMAQGLASRDFSEVITSLSEALTGVWAQGSFAVVSKHAGDFRVNMLVHGDSDTVTLLDDLVARHPEMFERDGSFQRVPDTPFGFQSCHFSFAGIAYALVFLAKINGPRDRSKTTEFFGVLAQELKLLTQLLGHEEPATSDEAMERKTTVNIVAGNPAMKRLIAQAKKFAQSDIFVLIQGESGTGKELFARLIHEHSRRANGEFVALNCAAMPENLLESELFGYEKGAFTGAQTQRKGKLELSSGGTLVLDEIGNMPAELQKKLLRAVQEQEFYRLGGATQIKVDLRIISITNEDLKELVAAGTFRKDLYYRLVHRMMIVPPLRERREDIPVLINFFTHKFCRLCGKHISGFTVKAYMALQNHNWDGNVRELENEINVLVNLADDGGSIDDEMLSDSIKESTAEAEALSVLAPPKLDEASEREALIQLLQHNDWNKSQTARKLDMTYRGLHEKMKRMGIVRPARQ